jgi:hypothetical protein
MGVSLSLENHDLLFQQQTAHIPIILNDYNNQSEDSKRQLNELIYTATEGDVLSNIPACSCNATFGEHKLNAEDPVICPECGTPVVAKFEKKIDPLLWIRSPNGVEKLINPVVWTMMKREFTKGGFEVIRWICDPYYKVSSKQSKYITAVNEMLMGLNVRRGYNAFIQNFDAIIDGLYSMRLFAKPGRKKTSFKKFLERYRDAIFSDYIPLPNRALLVVENTNVGRYMDPIILDSIDAIQTMAGIDSDLNNFTVQVKENRTLKTIVQLAAYYESVYRFTLGKKQGILRKHVFGSRAHFSFRAVVSSLTGSHFYDEIHIPWNLAVTVLRVHLANKLEARGFSPNDIFALLNEYTTQYHPLLDELFKELIAEAPGGAIPATMQRNPSLNRGSCQAVGISRVKTDMSDPTVSISFLAVVAMNCDFDGELIAIVKLF